MANKLHTYIESIHPRGLLSFGMQETPIALDALNVLIGPNASGKSNLIDLVRLVRSLPGDLQDVVGRGGGSDAWIWQGVQELVTRQLHLSVLFRSRALSHLVELRKIRGQSNELRPIRERITLPQQDRRLFEREPQNQATIRNSREETDVHVDLEEPSQSILSQIYSTREYPEITALARFYSAIRIYSTWEFGREALLRRAQPADNRGDRVEEDYSNLGLYLSQLGTAPKAKQNIIDGLRELYEGFTNYEIIVNSGSVQIFFTEGNEWSIPATRLSDGTLRYLCLLAILYNPKPPPLVCIEEPELGLHPDIVAGLAKHLQAASERMQLIVTTHSDILVDALTDVPASIIVCENVDGATQMKRLDPEAIKGWLEDYRLGELWSSGHIGGNRW